MGMATRATIANRRPLVFHEDVFYEYFKPYRHPLSHHDIWGGHGLETYGEDFDLVRTLDPARSRFPRWTGPIPTHA